MIRAAIGLLLGLGGGVLAQEANDPSRLLTPVPSARGFKNKPSCPAGTIAVPSSSPFQPFRCVMGGPGALSEAAEKLAGLKRYEREGVSFQFPARADLTDAWSDEPPAVYLVLESGDSGKPVSVFVSWLRPGRPGYQSMNTAILREKEDLGAQDAGRGKISGLPARFTKLGKEGRTAYVALAGGAYYTIAFSCPDALFEQYHPVYQRLLKSFRAASPDE